MIVSRWLNDNAGVLVVRDERTPRTAQLDDCILENGWGLRLGLQYGQLLLEAWGSAGVVPVEGLEESGFIRMQDVASEYGVPLEVLVQQMLEDGLLLEVDGALVASPHPAVRRMD